MHSRLVALGRAMFATLLIAFFSLGSLASAAERILYEKASAYNNIIVTEDEGGARVLRFERNGARQSIVKPGDPTYLGFAYTRAAFVGLALVDDPQRFLIVGLGGGTMPMFLRHYYPSAAIDVVDIDPEVVNVAKEYFGFREDENLHAHVADGRQFIESVREPYDVIFLDAFGARNVPPHLTTVEFMRAVKRALKPSGVLVGNVWGRAVNPIYDSVVRTYHEVFDELYIVDAPGTSNQIFLGLPRRYSLDRPRLVQLARRLGARKQFAYDLADISEEHFRAAPAKGTSGRVLRDVESRQPVHAQ